MDNQILGRQRNVHYETGLQVINVVFKIVQQEEGLTSQVTRTSTGFCDPESQKTSALQDASTQATHQPKPTIFVSDHLLECSLIGLRREGKTLQGEGSQIF